MERKAVSGIMLTLLLIGMLTLAFNVQPVKASGTVYIRPDGSVDPPTAPIHRDGNIYTFTDNIYDEIVVERDNIIVDGAGYTLQGSGSGTGVALSGRKNVTITNIEIKSFAVGIWLISSNYSNVFGNKIKENWRSGIMVDYSLNNGIFRNNIENNGNGIWLTSSDYNVISKNNLTAQSFYGIQLAYSLKNTIYHNNVVNNNVQISCPKSYNNTWDDGYPSGGNYWSDYTGVDADGDGIGDTPYVIDTNNTDRYPLMHTWSSLPVHNINTGLGYEAIQEAINANETINGHTIFVEEGTYYENVVVNKTLTLIGESTNTTIIDGNVDYYGIFAPKTIMVEANDVIITKFTIRNEGVYGDGMVITESFNTSLFSNVIARAYWDGVRLEYSSYCHLFNNTITKCGGSGIRISSSCDNKMSGNIITEYGGVSISRSSNNTLSENNLINTWGGFYFYEASNNRISENNIVNSSGIGVVINRSFDNRFYHNNFINNTNQVYVYELGYANTWDAGYPSGGNYWSDHVCTGNPNGGSQPYIIDADNIDHYPFQDHNGWLTKVHNIDTGLDYVTIQEAVDASETLDGHTIFVEAGTYYEHVLVNKSLALIGENRENTIIDGGGIGNILHVVANNTFISGFSIQNGGPTYFGIYFDHSSHNTLTSNNITNNYGSICLSYSSNNILSNNDVTNNYDGISLYNAFNNTISGNRITSNFIDGIHLLDSFGNTISDNNITNNYWYGVYLGYSYSNTLFSNNIINNDYGFLLESSSGNNTLSGNKVTNNHYGIYLAGYSYNNTLSENNITNNEAGIYLDSCSGNSLSGNNITNNGDGIYLWNSSNNWIYDNNIANNGWGGAILAGIRLWVSSNNSISGNNIMDNNMGFTFGSSSDHNIVFENNIAINGDGIFFAGGPLNKFHHNDFINNTKQVRSESGVSVINIWDDEYPSGGNYWSDYNGVDSNGDGIGDTPYVIDADNRDRYPLMKPWSLMPTVYTFSIVWGEETFIVTVESNSTVSNFVFNQPNKEISFSVAGSADTIGFCNVSIPKSLLWVADLDEWIILVDGQLPLFVTTTENATHTMLYFTYTQSTHQIQLMGTHVIGIPPPPLSASISPLSASILVGQSVTFTSTVSGGYTPYTYQWYLNGVPVSGANQSSWTFTPTEAGIYYVYLKVTDAKGNTTQSETARITVTTVPVGGYSVPIQLPTTAQPATLNISLLTIVTAIFITIKRKTKRKH